MEKLLYTKMIQLHDTEAKWSQMTDFVPQKSMLIVYDIDATHNYERLKVGDGVKTVPELPFLDDAVKELITSQMELVDKKIVDASEITVGSTEPTNPNIKLWMDTSTTDGNVATIKFRDEQGNFVPVPTIKGDDGITFVPKISAKGDLSWTNNGELPNPPSVNIMGFVYKGMNPLATKGLDQDIPAHWAGAGSGYWWISGGGNLKEQPNYYGFLFSLVYGSGECFQCLFCPAVNNIYIRSGGAGTNNSDGWYRNDNNSYIWKYIA